MTHGRCSTIEKMFLPTRLIFIGDSLPRLMQAIEIKGCPKCATLSHCWGKLKSLVLRQDNVETFATRIPQEALPQSFKDAIEVARSLDIDYLWIDSLCIIQNNDSDDWAKEAAQMSSIYGGSYLNIAATSAVDGSKGFLGNWHCFNSGFRAKISTHSWRYFLHLCAKEPLSRLNFKLAISPTRLGCTRTPLSAANCSFHF
jgi:hypothetical protein